MQDASRSQRRIAPLAGEQRLVALDWLRGLAVLGILFANITAFSNIDIAYYWPDALPGGAHLSDRLVWLAQFVFVDGKFRGVFSILFGAGMVLFIGRAGGPSTGSLLQLRRLALLALFGLAHFYLLFKGDILFSYACAGFFALAAVPLSARIQLSAGVVWLLGGAVLQGLAYVPAVLAEAGNPAFTNDVITAEFYQEFWQGRVAEARLEGEIIANGSYADILRHRFEAESSLLVSGFTQNFFETIPLMLIGMGLYRADVFRRAEDRPPWQGLAIVAVVTGLAINLAAGVLVFARDFPPFLTQFAFFGVSQFANTFVLAGGVPLLARYAAQAGEGRLGERLSAAGRMAFSNYVGTSVLMVLVFQGWAVGLFGQLHRLELLAVVLLTWALILGWSKPWLAHFRQGPLEWLWRCLTYGRLFPFKR